MGKLLVKVQLEGLSGWSEDSAVNDFAIDTGVAPVTAFDLAIGSAIDGFYNDARTAHPGGLAEGIAKSIDRSANACRVKMYDVTNVLSGQPAGSPVASGSFTLNADNNTAAIPSECATVATLRGLGWDTVGVEGPLNTRPRQRRTGRLYLGPLNGGTLELEAGTNRTRVRGIWNTAMREAVNALHDELKALATPHLLSVWSRRAGAFYEVVRVETDDAFDTQRRRGVNPTLRTGLAV